MIIVQNLGRVLAKLVYLGSKDITNHGW